MYVINTLLLDGWFGSSVFAKMLNSLADAIVNLVAHLCGALVGGCINVVNTIGVDIARIINLFPALSTISNAFIWTGVTITFVLLIVSLPTMFMSRFTDSDLPASNPFQLVCRTAVALLLCNLFVPVMDKYVVGQNGIFTVLFEHFINMDVSATSSVTENYVLTCLTSGMISGSSDNLFATGADIATFFIMLIFFIYLCILLLKFLFFHIQKYLFTTILLSASPLAASTYVNKKTATIWKNYVSLLAVNLITLIFNIIMMKFIQSGLYNLVSWKEKFTIANDSADKSYTILLGVMAICAIAKIGKQISVYIGQLFNVNGMTEQVRASLGEIGGVVATGFAAYSGIDKFSKMTKAQNGADTTSKVLNNSDSGNKNGGVDTKSTGKQPQDEKAKTGRFGKSNGMYYKPNGASPSSDSSKKSMNDSENKKGTETKPTDIDKDNNADKSVPGSPDNYKNPNKKGSETSTVPQNSNDKNDSEAKNDSKRPNNDKGAETTNVPQTSRDTDKKETNNTGASVEKNGVVTNPNGNAKDDSAYKGSVRENKTTGGSHVESAKVQNSLKNKNGNTGGQRTTRTENSGGYTKNVNTSGANTKSHNVSSDVSTYKSSHSTPSNHGKNTTQKTTTSDNAVQNKKQRKNREGSGEFKKRKPADTN